MVASSLDLQVEHTHRDEEIEEGFMHPWAREMYGRGVTFNGKERDKLFLGRGDGRFDDLSDLSGADSGLDGRGLVAADFDDDGDLDLFAHHLQRGRHALLRNELGDGVSFAKVRLANDGPNWEGVGATVTAYAGGAATSQVVARGAGFISCGPAELVFGLGAAKSATLEVRWPDGVVEAFGSVDRGARVLLERGAGEPKALPARPTRLRDPLPAGLDLDVGELGPDLVLSDRDAAPLRRSIRELGAERGLLVHFWASYCEPCVRELARLGERAGDPDGPAVLAISVDARGDWERAAALLERSTQGRVAAHFVSLSDADNAGGLDDLVDLLRLPIPTTLVFDREGRLVRVDRGVPD